MFLLIGHFCPTDASPEDYPDMGTLNGDLIVYMFETRAEAEEFESEDFWLPDGTIVEVPEEDAKSHPKHRA